MGVGQGYLLVTPLQLAHVAGVLAERGASFRPRLVNGVRDANGHVQWLAPIEDEPITGVSAPGLGCGNRCDDRHHALRAYCGTASAAFKDAAYQVAGKTGTAQVYTVAQNEKYNAKTVPERLRDHAWFIAFAPADAPRIAVAVLVENAGFGASNAAPIARKVHRRLPARAGWQAEAADAADTRGRRTGGAGRQHFEPGEAAGMIYEEVTSGSRTRRTLSGAARVLFGAEARRSAGDRTRPDRRLRARRSSTVPPGQSIATIMRTGAAPLHSARSPCCCSRTSIPTSCGA